MNTPYKQGHYFYLMHEDINVDLSFPTKQQKETADKVSLCVWDIFNQNNARIKSCK